MFNVLCNMFTFKSCLSLSRGCAKNKYVYKEVKVFAYKYYYKYVFAALNIKCQCGAACLLRPSNFLTPNAFFSHHYKVKYFAVYNKDT